MRLLIGAAIVALSFSVQAEQLDPIIPTFEECELMINHEIDLLQTALDENVKLFYMSEYQMYQAGNDLMRSNISVTKENIDITWSRLQELKEESEF